MQVKQLSIIFYRKNRLTVFFSLVFITFLILLFTFSRLFTISRISLDGSDYINGLDRVADQNIFFISIPDIEQYLYKINPDVQSVIVRKIYPHSLALTIKRAKVAAQLEVANGFFLLTKDTRIMAKKRNKETTVPVVTYYQKLHFDEYEVGEALTKKDILFSVFFIDHFSKVGITVNHIDITSLNMIVLYAGDQKYLFTTEKNRAEQFQIFETIYRKIQVAGFEYSGIDMRSNKPIIKIKK